MKQKVRQITSDQVDQMIILKWHQRVSDPYQRSFVSYATIGKIYDIDGSSA